MLIPLGTDRPSVRPPVVTWSLLCACLVVFLAQVVVRQADAATAARLEWPLMIKGGSGFRWWQLWSSAFLHGGVMHLAGNAVFLWVFGKAVEARLGSLRFAVFYLAGAAASAGLHAVFERVPVGRPMWPVVPGPGAESPDVQRMTDIMTTGFAYVPALGASGAIAAATGAFLVLSPRARVRCFSLWLLYIGRIDVPAWWFIGLAIAWDLLAQGTGMSGNVAYLAHLGGYGFGIATAMTLLWLKVLKREPYDLFTMARQAKRRADLRAAGAAWRTTAPQRAKQREGRGASAGLSDELARKRAEVTRAIAASDVGAALSAWRGLRAWVGEQASAKRMNEAEAAAAMVLGRAAQQDFGAVLAHGGHFAEAAQVFEAFAAMYPRDRQTPLVRLFLVRLLRERLGDPARARAVLGELTVQSMDAEARALAEAEAAALGVAWPMTGSAGGPGTGTVAAGA